MSSQKSTEGEEWMNKRKIREATCRQHLGGNLAEGPVGSSGSRGISWAGPGLYTTILELLLESFWPEVNCCFELMTQPVCYQKPKANGFSGTLHDTGDRGKAHKELLAPSPHWRFVCSHANVSGSSFVSPVNVNYIPHTLFSLLQQVSHDCSLKTL